MDDPVTPPTDPIPPTPAPPADPPSPGDGGAPPIPSSILGGDPPKPELGEDGKPKSEVQTETKDAKPTGAPEKYEFVAPEGMTLDETAIGKFEPIARELNLTQEQANKLVALHAEQAAEGQKAHDAAWTKTQENWKASIVADKEFGGAVLETTARDANLALTKFATPEDISELQRLGLGNCPPLVKLLARAGKLMAEDVMHKGGNEGAKPVTPKDMFPKSNMN